MFWYDDRYYKTYLQSSFNAPIFLFVAVAIFTEKLRALWHLFLFNCTDLHLIHLQGRISKISDFRTLLFTVVLI